MVKISEVAQIQSLPHKTSHDNDLSAHLVTLLVLAEQEVGRSRLPDDQYWMIDTTFTI
jgi:hypothetical protein